MRNRAKVIPDHWVGLSGWRRLEVSASGSASGTLDSGAGGIRTNGATVRGDEVGRRPPSVGTPPVSVRLQRCSVMPGIRRFCDRIERRSLLRVGALAGGGLTLSQLLAAEQAAVAAPGSGGSRSWHQSVIMVYLSGGIAHQDTFDLKPGAPAETRGEFQPIATSVPGMEICELLPKLAEVAHRFSLLRACVGQRDEHTSFQNLTGYTMGEAQRIGYPNFGSMVARVQGPTDPVTPPFVDLFPTMQHRPYNSTGAGYLGPKFHQVRADGEDVAGMKLRYVEPPQFASRRELLQTLGELQAYGDRPEFALVSESYQRAFEVLTSSRLVDALDLEREPAEVRERYAGGSSKHLGDGAPLWNSQLLMARRLVEAGGRGGAVASGLWDTPRQKLQKLRAPLPAFDAGLAALITDIYERGLDRDVTLVVWGEFGRTPKINGNAGRDHWAPVQSVLLSGGGLRTGQVLGSTDQTAAYAATRPVHYRDVLATVYHALGIDPHQYVRDANDRPVQILPDDARPIRQLC